MRSGPCCTYLRRRLETPQVRRSFLSLYKVKTSRQAKEHDQGPFVT